LYRIAIVDDSSDIRTLLARILETSPAFEVCGEGSSGQAAIELAESAKPDVMLLDLSMPGIDGLDALEQIRQHSPGTRVVLLSGFEFHTFADKAIALGAVGYLMKDGSMMDMAERLLALLDPPA
jgi:DNA-binding NarL/FixJ family response regulator